MESLEKNNDFDFKHSLLPPEKQKALNELRILQIGGELTEEQRKKFMELSREETERKGKPLLTEEEKTKLRELRKKQIEGKWTTEDANRLLELQEKE